MGRKAHRKEDVWQFILKGGTNECWEWQRKRNHHGYGEFSIKHKSYRAHRIVYELTHNVELRSISQSKPKIDDQLVLHSCDNPSCCNPRHLFLGTHKKNMEDMVKKGRRHNFDGERGQTAKLSNKQATLIRKLANEGTPQKFLAEKYGVSQCTISSIKHNKVYCDV
jgi:hypothetical protein